MLDEAAARESELKELERKAIEAHLGDKFSFSLTETAKILNPLNEMDEAEDRQRQAADGEARWTGNHPPPHSDLGFPDGI